jgi:hypothetical protein
MAKQEEAKELALVEKLTPKIAEAVAKQYKTHLDGQSAEITRLKKLVEKPTDDKKDDEGGKTRMSAADKDINERLTKVEDREKKATARAVRTGVRLALMELGREQDLDEATIVFMHDDREGKKVSLADDGETVMWAEVVGAEPIPLMKAVKDNKLKTYHRAKALPKTGPSSGPQGRGGNGKVSMTRAEFTQAQRDGAKLDLNNIDFTDV